jgi:ankyrin repeat protein
LIDAGADFDATDNRGATALIYAALDGHFECASALVERGANLEAMTLDGYTALLLSVKNTKQSDLTSQSWSNVRVKVKTDRIKTIRILVEHGANVNARDKRGQTALTLAERTTSLKSLLS